MLRQYRLELRRSIARLVIKYYPPLPSAVAVAFAPEPEVLLYQIAAPLPGRIEDYRYWEY